MAPAQAVATALSCRSKARNNRLILIAALGVFQDAECLSYTPMTANGLFARPHRLLLARFFSQGLVVAAIVTFAVGAVLTYLDRGNPVEHAADSAFERVARVAERIGNGMENMPPAVREQMQNGQSPIQQLVAQESQYGGMLRLEVVDGAGVIVGSGDEAALGKTSDTPEVIEAMNSARTVSRVIGPDSAPYLRVAAAHHRERPNIHRAGGRAVGRNGSDAA